MQIYCAAFQVMYHNFKKGNQNKESDGPFIVINKIQMHNV